MRQSGIPGLIWGVLGGMLLIVLVSRGCGAQGNLRGVFAPRPGDPSVAVLPLPALSLAALPEGVRNAHATASALLGQEGDTPALTPVAEGSGLRVSVERVDRRAAGVGVKGSIVNTGDTERVVPATALTFQDTQGQVYALSSGSATIAPGGRAAIDMTVPIAEGSGLTLVVSLPPDPPLTLVLLAKP